MSIQGIFQSRVATVQADQRQVESEHGNGAHAVQVTSENGQVTSSRVEIDQGSEAERNQQANIDDFFTRRKAAQLDELA